MITVVWTLEASLVGYVRAAAEGIIPDKFKLFRKDETRQIIQKNLEAGASKPSNHEETTRKNLLSIF